MSTDGTTLLCEHGTFGWAHADREFELEMDAAQGGEVTFATEQGKEISDAVKLAHRSWSRAKREAVLAQSDAAPSPRRPRRPRSSSMRRSNTGIQLMPMTPPIPAGLPHPPDRRPGGANANVLLSCYAELWCNKRVSFEPHTTLISCSTRAWPSPSTCSAAPWRPWPPPARRPSSTASSPASLHPATPACQTPTN